MSGPGGVAKSTSGGGGKQHTGKHSTPHLPKQLVHDLLTAPGCTLEPGFTSQVFSEWMHDVRLDIVNVNNEVPLSPDAIVPNLDAAMGLRGEDVEGERYLAPETWTLLHYAIILSDHLLAMEMIRCAAFLFVVHA